MNPGLLPRDRSWLVLGAAGQLGNQVVQRLKALGQQVEAVTREDVDIGDSAQVAEVLHRVRPTHVVNAAAYTDVDEAESRPDLSLRVNAHGPAGLAFALARDLSASLVHVSTDYVFGHADKFGIPWSENAPPAPVNEYGKTKAQGERAVRRLLPERSVVVRTSWLYAPGYRNFVATMVARAREGVPSQVVADQWGQPTWARDTADLIIELAIRLGRGQAPAGIYHATNAGRATWFELAKRIYLGVCGKPELVTPITSDELVRAAARPSWSVLGHDAWHLAGMSPPRPWQEALDEALPLFLAEGELSL